MANSRTEATQALLNVRRLPGRLNAAEAAIVLGFAEHDIVILVRTKLLRPLGKPKPNAVKYFSSVEIEEVAHNPDWLTKATAAIYAHWQRENDRRLPNEAATANASDLAA